MIISENNKPAIEIFRDIMRKTDTALNSDARQRENYYIKRGGKLLESDVCDAIIECAKGTEFEGTISLVSGLSFPDIIANKLYGVEVKSTEKNHWTSIGSSILESTRDVNVKRIFLTFGKLGKPVQFLTRPYEECLAGIAVTHYPRYQIDMRLQQGETIFDKMGCSYDELRAMENPVVPVSKYYKRQLKPGESLWWAADDIDTDVPVTVSLWNALPVTTREQLTAQGYALFPEVLGKRDTKKYNNYSLWLATKKGVVNTCVRDSFSAGGQVMINVKGISTLVPAVFGRISKYRNLIVETITNESEESLKEYWSVNSIQCNRILQWCLLVSNYAIETLGFETAKEILFDIFNPYI